MEGERGTGRTTRQMVAAPKGSIFVWCNRVLNYPRNLARSLNRSDLRIIPVDDLRWDRLAGLNLPLILDHAAEPNDDQWRVLVEYRARLDRAPRISPPTQFPSQEG